jgi:Uma2 family endonuclease
MPATRQAITEVPQVPPFNRIRVRDQVPPLKKPPLKNGDRLTRSEFERRYHTMPQIKKAELIEGVVYMSSPVRVKHHALPHAHIVTWLGVYSAVTPKIMLCDNATVRLDLDNEPQPDALLRLEKGQSRISHDDYLEDAPELVVEIAASSADYDLHGKLQVYQRNGVQEYIVWEYKKRRLYWFAQMKGTYVPLSPDKSGIICSQIFPGLHLDIKALLAGDLNKVLTELQKGLATPEHTAFVERLSQN